jgi:CDP-2,3-bis-(O-geranylgeranyl)-sn-glycerol synthase
MLMAGWLNRLLQLTYFMLPAYAANMAPPFLKYWRGWNPPIAPRWLGTHKTVFGFAAGVGVAVLVAWLQSRIAWERAPVDADVWLGLRLGAGAMAGDSAKSFLKRRAGIAPGAPWIPFDQLDFAVGALAFTWSRASLSWADVAAILGLAAAGHVVVNHVGYWLGIRDTKW